MPFPFGHFYKHGHILKYQKCYKMCKQQLNHLIIILCIPLLTVSFNLQILEPDVLQPMVFVNGHLADYYNASVYEQHFVCTNGQLEIIEFEESPQDQLIVFRYSGAELMREDINITVEPNLEPKPYIKDFNRVYKKFVLSAGCPSPITNNNYFNRVKVRMIVHQQQPTRKLTSKYQRKTEPKLYEFNFLLNCDLWDVHKHFEYGYIFISIICITVVIFVSLHPRVCSLLINHKPINFQIKWKWFLGILGVIMGMLGFIYSKKMELITDLDFYFGKRNQNQARFQLANGLLKHLGLISSLVSVFVCSSQLFFEWNFLLKPIPFNSVKIFGQIISKRVIMSCVISITCYIIGLLNENWIYYNMLSFCIAICAVKMFRFRSLKNGFITMLIVVVDIVIFTIWSHYALPRSVNDYASQLSSPLFVEVPDLVNNLYKKCSWISIYDMILPGAVLAYLRDYDENYNVGWKGVYTFTSLIAFSLSCAGWVIIEALSEYNVPFCVIIYPPFILSVVLLSLYRNQFETLWHGYFHFSMDLSILQMIEQYRKSNNEIDLKHIFPKEIIDSIKYEQSRWSEGQSMQMTHRRPLDDNELEVWSASLEKSGSFNSQSETQKEQSKKNLFISQNLEIPRQNLEQKSKYLSSSQNIQEEPSSKKKK